MANFDLKASGNTNLQTSFRFEVFFPSSVTGTNDIVSAYCISSQIPKATGEPIPWHMPMGMINHQAGKRTIQPVQLEFVIPEDSTGDAYTMLETWCPATYDLNTGTNIKKAQYAVDGVEVRIKGGAGLVTKKSGNLLREEKMFV